VLIQDSLRRSGDSAVNDDRLRRPSVRRSRASSSSCCCLSVWVLFLTTAASAVYHCQTTLRRRCWRAEKTPRSDRNQNANAVIFRLRPPPASRAAVDLVKTESAENDRAIAPMARGVIAQCVPGTAAASSKNSVSIIDVWRSRKS
jgi:hypothetical protein